jgi:hypothetical protein
MMTSSATRIALRGEKLFAGHGQVDKRTAGVPAIIRAFTTLFTPFDQGNGHRGSSCEADSNG